MYRLAVFRRKLTFSWITSSFRKDISLILHWLCLALTAKFICTTWPHMTICLFWLGSDACKGRADLSHQHAVTKVINPAGRRAGVMLAHGKVLIGPFPGALLPDQRTSGTAPPSNSRNSFEHYLPLESNRKNESLLCIFFAVDSFWLLISLHLEAVFQSNYPESGIYSNSSL